MRAGCDRAEHVCAWGHASMPTLTILPSGITAACCLTLCQSNSSSAMVDAGESNKTQIAPWYLAIGSEQDTNGILACGDKWFSVPTDLRHFGSPTHNADGASTSLLSQVLITVRQADCP